MSSVQASHIAGLGHYAPERRVENSQIESQLGREPGRIERRPPPEDSAVLVPSGDNAGLGLVRSILQMRVRFSSVYLRTSLKVIHRRRRSQIIFDAALVCLL